MRRGLPRGHPHPRSRPVADAGQVRGGTDRPRDRLPGDPGRPVGRPAAAAAVLREAAAGAASADPHEGGRPRRPQRPADPGAERRDHQRRHRPDHGGGGGARRRPARGDRTEPSCSTTKTAGVREIGNRARGGRPDEPDRGLRGRVLGHRVLDRARRRRQRRHHLGSARGGLRGDHRDAREPRLPARHQAARNGHRHPRPGCGRRRCRRDHLRRTVPVVPREPHRVGAACSPRCRWSPS